MYLIQTFFLGMNVLIIHKNDLYRCTYLNNIEILMWEILTHIVYIETHDISDEMIRVANIVPNFQSLQIKFNRYISKGNYYPCSYLLRFRSVLLEKKLVSEV